jgi:ATP-dependent exoDNAse (exonuclease V) beta subunit
LVVVKDDQKLSIVDWKTDRPGAEQDGESHLMALRAKYSPQLRVYREVLAKIFRCEVDRCEIYSTASQRAIEIEH